MAQRRYQYISELARHPVAVGIEQGRKKMFRKLLGWRFGELTAEASERIQAASCEQVDIWVERVLTAQTLDQIFADS